MHRGAVVENRGREVGGVDRSMWLLMLFLVLVDECVSQ